MEDILIVVFLSAETLRLTSNNYYSIQNSAYVSHQIRCIWMTTRRHTRDSSINSVCDHQFQMNLSVSNCNPPFFVPSHCVLPADAMMRHLLACTLLILLLSFLPDCAGISLRCTLTTKGGEPGIWLPLTWTNSCSLIHMTAVWCRRRDPHWEITQEMQAGGGGEWRGGEGREYGL